MKKAHVFGLTGNFSPKKRLKKENRQARKCLPIQITDKLTIFRWVFVIHIKFLILIDKKCKSLFQRIFAIFFIFCTAEVSKHCSETLSFPHVRQ